jgi:hypothetical protein
MPVRNSAKRRYNHRALGLSLAYAGALIGVSFVFRDDPPTGPIAWALALLPAIPLVGIFLAMAGTCSRKATNIFARSWSVRLWSRPASC